MFESFNAPPHVGVRLAHMQSGSRISARVCVGIPRFAKIIVVLQLCCAAAGCASANFVSSSKNPDAQPLDLANAKVAAVVIMEDQTRRRSAEDALAREISAQGAIGVSMYGIHADATPSNEPAVRAALEAAQVQGVVVMRPVSVDIDAEVTPVTYSEPMYREYWGSYYGTAWGTPYAMAEVTGGDLVQKTTVVVETLVYSMRQNQLVWSGQSKHVNPSGLEKSIQELARATARELRKQGLISNR